MNAQHNELWQRLEQFQLDAPGASLPFSSRLARENSWTLEYTRRVIDEYKRFVFLTVAAGHPVSPPEDVDQVWHLHLVYSENYWKVFCPQVLEQPLHHRPSEGGWTERCKFENWYARTRGSYTKLFGQAPPADIWPSLEEHAKQNHRFTRVDRERNWVVPKPRLRVPATWTMRFLAAMLALGCCGAMMGNGVNVFDWRGPDFLKFYMLLLATCYGLAAWTRWSLRLPVASGPVPAVELDGYQLAFLNGGKVLTVNTAIANLARQRALRIDEKELRLTSLVPRPGSMNELEKSVYAASDSTSGTKIAEVRSAAKTVVTGIADELKAKGLVVADGAARTAVAIPLILALSAVTIGLMKLMIGLNRGKPVGFLMGLCITALLAAVIGFGRRPLRSRLGDAALEKLQKGHVGSRRLAQGTANLPSAEFATMLGLFGMSALADTELEGLRKTLQPASGISVDGGSGADGCGGGCGGGGCGGGCGGCGGCGGD